MGWLKKTKNRALLLVGVLVFGLMLKPVGAQFAFVVGALSGMTHSYAAPAYLKSSSFTATTTNTLIHSGATVLGCVVINTAGAAGSTIKLYNSYGAIAGYIMATIDATKVGSQFCYGNIFSGALTVAIASGGAAPDVTITYQGK